MAQNWRTHIDKYILPSLGNLRIQTVGIEQVENDFAEYREALTTLSAIFKLAQRYGPIQGKANVAELAERIKISNDDDGGEQVTGDSVYSEEELKKIINTTAPGSFERVLIMAPTLTRLRIGEVLGLQWSAVDLKNGKLHVRTNLGDVGKANGGRDIRAPKSKSGRRVLDLPQELAKELKVWKLACPPSEQDLVFATMEGKPLHRKLAMQPPKVIPCKDTPSGERNL